MHLSASLPIALVLMRNGVVCLLLLETDACAAGEQMKLVFVLTHACLCAVPIPFGTQPNLFPFDVE